MTNPAKIERVRTLYDVGADPQGNVFKKLLEDYERKAQDVLRETGAKFFPKEEELKTQECIPNDRYVYNLFKKMT
jgi:hypothetical protein